MQPIGPLMIEHRLIERMISLLKNESESISSTSKVNTELLNSAVDFLRTYADKTHHGKEEDILFKELANKNLSEEHSRIMKELLEEHVLARKNVLALSELLPALAEGENVSEKVAEILNILIELYPRHISKEDKNFFPASMKYFSDKEQKEMLEKFFEFDRVIIHEKYKKIVESFESAK